MKVWLITAKRFGLEYKYEKIKVMNIYRRTGRIILKNPADAKKDLVRFIIMIRKMYLTR